MLHVARFRSLVLSLWIAPCLAHSAPAQDLESPGPFPVGWRSEDYAALLPALACQPYASASGRIYYPAVAAGHAAEPDLESGPYPLVVFLHGWPGKPADHDGIASHVASWGFAVASVKTSLPLVCQQAKHAANADCLLQAVELAAQDPTHWTHGLVDPARWPELGAVGYSCGGAALSQLVGLSQRISTLAAYEPGPTDDQFPSSGFHAQNVRDFPGALYLLSGDDSCSNKLAHSQIFFDAAVQGQARRIVHHLVPGLQHAAPVDDVVVGSSDCLPNPDGFQVTARWVAALLLGELKGQASSWPDLLGEEWLFFQHELVGQIGPKPTPLAHCREPLLWATAFTGEPGRVRVGVAGVQGRFPQLLASLAPAAVPTPFGLLSFDPSLGAPFHCARLRLDGAPTPGHGACVSCEGDGLECPCAPLPKGATFERHFDFPPALWGQRIYLQGLIFDPFEDHGQWTDSASVVIPS